MSDLLINVDIDESGCTNHVLSIAPSLAKETASQLDLQFSTSKSPQADAEKPPFSYRSKARAPGVASPYRHKARFASVKVEPVELR